MSKVDYVAEGAKQYTENIKQWAVMGLWFQIKEKNWEQAEKQLYKLNMMMGERKGTMYEMALDCAQVVGQEQLIEFANYIKGKRETKPTQDGFLLD